ncbi:MAG: hypothetical protein L3K06_00455, partial [Thermoplasmata archaeon]|nr:hypothetical protein [Thermoplasmata archaeon]
MLALDPPREPSPLRPAGRGRPTRRGNAGRWILVAMLLGYSVLPLSHLSLVSPGAPALGTSPLGYSPTGPSTV